ncbi:MAG: undecaprenyldiphospho-muramoylpentapeptide beta-N-acetylglucosaminyltransferase [Casimicrobiaceae bacterium]|nr:undecaprenyldiphospho-muramoylpentapeptide beta-N-acetylglucosaminyltransferase [Casimicrobiaceae bacterium]MCX8098813.1 undecaprenyldiphospho-muramoylpentapeptide beta-N-acetylglucosaminyltransferase [Casimicrobiaceae bacterium]MDW8311534.1 undecaprenyldiphospho-muramoylpentapeptide beta-N-acetylglucosaminyltransferase [Burkholderiales bacterium]
MSAPAPHLLVMAGGTGGHIMPGLAVAERMHARGWRISWLGTRGGMEEELVRAAHWPLLTVEFSAWVGQGWRARLALPICLLRAWRAIGARFGQDRPDVAIGFGGYPSVPGALWAWTHAVPLLVHQSDVVAGRANRLLARLATRVLVGFEETLREHAHKRIVTGNPLRAGFADAPTPAQRFAQRTGPLRLLVLGGSRGAAWLNETVPLALAQLPETKRPEVLHQCGRGAREATEAAYRRAGVRARVEEFVGDSLAAMCEADLLVGRAGASTVSELAAVGLGAILVPYPHHRDQQQLHNARVLERAGAAEVLDQLTTSAEALATRLLRLDRARCLELAERARRCARLDATERICEAIVAAVRRDVGGGR